MTTDNRVEIYDTTLRDGTQAEGVSLSLEDKLLIAERLDALGVDYVEGGYPLSNPKDAAFFQHIRSRKLAHAKIAAFGMTRRRGIAADQDVGLQALLDSQAPVCTIVGKSWDMQVTEVLRVTRPENLRMIADSVAFCAAEGREVVYDAEHFFDGYRANPRYAVDTLRAALDAGATRLVLCDTNGGSLPETIAKVLKALVRRLPEARLGIHTHNDSGLAVACALEAVRHGAVQVQGTINGVGERAGNADLTSVIPNLTLKLNRPCLRDGALAQLTEVSRFVYEVANLAFEDHQPFVGRSAFAHKGGMHVHAVQRNTSTYEHIDPSLVGNRRRVLVSELAGASNIVASAHRRFGLADDKDAQRRILQRVVAMEAEGYEFEAADGTLDVLIRKTLGEPWHRGPFWMLDHYRCNILRTDGEAATTEAVVRLVIDGQDEYTVADGDGPVNALDGALRKALRGRYPAIDRVHLDDYKVRVVNAVAGTAAKVRVAIRFHDEQGSFGTVGVSGNIIEASWLALTDAFEYKLFKDMDDTAGAAAPASLAGE
ncbi:MAG: citramalate synthase [Planctomycetes bacterium]|nr:citramalate synthase [Planctomycetota bacterium]